VHSTTGIAMTQPTYKPLYKLIRTEKNFYLYDNFTNQILNISEKVHKVLVKEKKSSTDLKYLEELSKRNGVLCPNHLRPKLPEFDVEEIKAVVENSCLQLSLEISQKCNLRCHYCVYSGQYASKRKHSEHLMSLETACLAVDYLASHSSHSLYVTVAFYGGEPLINFPLLKQITSYAQEKIKDRKIVFTVTTNSTLMKKEYIDFFIQNNFHLFISLDGPKYIHDKMRVSGNQKGSYDIVIKNMFLIKELSLQYFESNVHVSMVVHPGVDLSVLDSFLEEMGITSSKIATISDFGTQWRKEYIENPIRNEEAILEKYLSLAKSSELRSNLITAKYCLANSLFSASMSRLVNRRSSVPFSENFISLGNCIPGNRKIFVDCGGDIYPCEKTDSANHLLLGNIRTGGVQVEKVIEMMQSFYSFVTDSCAGCWLNKICDACFVQPTWGNEFNVEKLSYACKSMRSRYSKMLKLYCAIMEENPNGLDALIEF